MKYYSTDITGLSAKLCCHIHIIHLKGPSLLKFIDDTQ